MFFTFFSTYWQIYTIFFCIFAEKKKAFSKVKKVKNKK